MHGARPGPQENFDPHGAAAQAGASLPLAICITETPIRRVVRRAMKIRRRNQDLRAKTATGLRINGLMILFATCH
jgi:hypothetical protein